MSNSGLGIECRGISRCFGSRQALLDVNLEVRRGSLMALMGSNGAGKTSLMKILATLLLPTRGIAMVHGQDVVRVPMVCRRTIGFLPAEERSFHGRLSVDQNLKFFAALQGVAPGDFRHRSQALLAIVGLEGHGRTRFAELSSGMKQSLALVRSLLHDPAVLLLDEPTRSLSPDLACRVWDLLRDLAHHEGKTILLATHNLGEVESVADEMAILHQGHLVVQGVPSQICAAHGISALPRAEALFRHFTRETREAVAP